MLKLQGHIVNLLYNISNNRRDILLQSSKFWKQNIIRQYILKNILLNAETKKMKIQRENTETSETNLARTLHEGITQVMSIQDNIKIKRD